MNADKIVIVTGGTSGLGLELVKVLHENGYYVCNIARNKEKLDNVSKLFKTNHKTFCGDVSDEKFVVDTVSQIAKMCDGRYIAGLINNAGSASFKYPTEYTAKDIDLCMEGLKGMMYFSSNVLKYMEKTGGRIVNIMSSAALRGNKQESVYCATKWAERGYTESLKSAYSGTNVHIHGVYPGGINTNFYKNSRHYVSQEKQATFMSPKEVAEVIYDNIFNGKNLIVEDLIINRIK